MYGGCNTCFPLFQVSGVQCSLFEPTKQEVLHVTDLYSAVPRGKVRVMAGRPQV